MRIKIFLIRLSAWATAALVGGCAIYYDNPQTGAKTILGTGEMRLQTNQTGSFCQIVAGTKIPGLCLKIGPQNLGISVGYINEQQLAVVSSDSASKVRPPSSDYALQLWRTTNGLFGVGYITMNTPPHSHYDAVIDGRAVAGLQVTGVGRGAGVCLGSSCRQTVILRDDARLERDEVAPCWPGFDLFRSQVMFAKQ